MIKIKNLYKAYSKDDVLKNINLQFECGKIYGLAGSNGSGKSTLIKCICGIYPPDKGEVLMDEKEIYNSTAKEKIGLLFDEAHFLPMFSPKTYVKYYSDFYEGFSYEKFKEYCEKFDVYNKLKATGLSLGQAQKIHLSLVLARKCEYLVFDEPENGLDNESREVLRGVLREAADNGICVIISSHDLVNVENMCDELVLIDDGEIRFSGLVDDCLSSIQKVRVKAEDEKIAEYVITEDLGNIKTILVGGSRKEAEEKISDGIEIIDFEKVSVSDAYTYMRKGGMNSERAD